LPPAKSFWAAYSFAAREAVRAFRDTITAMNQAGTPINFTRPDGQSAPGLTFHGPSRAAPAIVLIQEWWGINAQICGVATRLADAGYNVLVPDLYRGKQASAREEAQHLMGSLNFPDALFQDLAGALATAREHHGKAAVMGFCMGGALTLAAAVHLPAASAAICFYGVPPAALADPRKLQVPLQCHFAEHDDWCTPEVVRNLEDQLQHLTIEHELHRYDAHHAFFNEARPEVHNPEAAALAWRRSLAFLARHLGA
jgi:carboxymethylenebutenolidase